MISITDKVLCCGCGACAQSCPRQCITMHENIEGFLYPHVNEANCIDCGLCEKVCPFLNPYSASRPQHTYAAINPDNDIRRNSSSGGIFYLLASAVLKDGGVVFGAVFNGTWDVVISYIEDISDIKKMQGSKYVQANTIDSFRKCKAFLDSGRKVLYTGTPCHISGLKHFLRKDYDNLYLVDFVCHGTPSPKVWKLYVNEIQEALNTIRAEKSSQRIPTSLSSRFALSFDNERNNYYLYASYGENDYMRLFLNNSSLRPSCFSCKVKGCSSHSDITIGDFWGINYVRSEFDDGLGVSSIMIHTEKGIGLFKGLRVKYIETTFEECYVQNSSLMKSSIPNINRLALFDGIYKDVKISTLIKDLFKPTIKETIKIFLKSVIRKKNSLPFNVLKKGDMYVISDIQFRNKQNGWRSYGIRIDLQNNK